MRILIAEDEPIIALELQRIVQEEGHQAVGPASTLEQALAYAPRVDAALVDLGLSDGSSGAALARRLIDRFQIKVIFVTGRPDAVGAGLEGSVDIIGKPFSDDSVRRSLAKALS
jgi:DNA-binding response OmpR family regulator